MNAIALCHNRDLQKTNGGIIVLGTGSISLMETATWVNMQPYSQSKWFVLHLDYVMVRLSASCRSAHQLACLSARLFHGGLSIRPPTFLSQAVALGSTRLPGRRGDQSGWTRVVFCFLKRAAKPVVFFTIQHASQRQGPGFVVCWL